MTTLCWGIKRSLIDYLHGPARGRIETYGGAEEDGQGQFLFPCAVVSDVRIEFRGSVRLLGHGGLLAVELDDPMLVRGEESWILAATVADNVVSLAEITRFISPDDSSLEAQSTRLTEIGSRVFQGQYPTGTMLDNPIVYT